MMASNPPTLIRCFLAGDVMLGRGIDDWFSFLIMW
jgi:hypothetical protein